MLNYETAGILSGVKKLIKYERRLRLRVLSLLGRKCVIGKKLLAAKMLVTADKFILEGENGM